MYIIHPTVCRVQPHLNKKLKIIRPPKLIHAHMNIFYLSYKTSRCARWHCDKHVVKMILETAQLLYTAHWVISVTPDFSTAPCRKNKTERGYLSIRNKNHPSAIWTRASIDHYMWLCRLGLSLCKEYHYRFGNKKHACEEHLVWLLANPPGLPRAGWSQPTQAMPDVYKNKNSLIAYRKYYSYGKSHILTYTGRHAPHWI